MRHYCAEAHPTPPFLCFGFCVLRAHAYSFTIIPVQTDKAARDSESTRGSVERFVLHLAEGAGAVLPRGSVTRQTLTVSPRATQGHLRYQEFPRIDDARTGAKQCFYYALEWYHDDVTKGAMAIAKQDVCRSEKGRVDPGSGSGSGTSTAYWHRPAHFPSEAIFVPSDRDGRAEDEGVLLFVSLAGAEEGYPSHLHIINATTMADVADITLPLRIPYQAHGQFYPGTGMFNQSSGSGAGTSARP